jgi:hypothetical protein
MGNHDRGKPQELKNQIGPKCGAARSRPPFLADIRTGRLFKIAGNGNTRLMIEVPTAVGIQNPAYRFAAVHPFPSR